MKKTFIKKNFKKLLLEKEENRTIADGEIKSVGIISVDEITNFTDLKTEVEKNRKSGKHVIFDIDVIGALNIKKKYPNQTLSIFINPPSISILEERLRLRGTESETALQERIEKAEEELRSAEKFDKSIVNNDLKKSKNQIIMMVKQFIDS